MHSIFINAERPAVRYELHNRQWWQFWKQPYCLVRQEHTAALVAKLNDRDIDALRKIAAPGVELNVDDILVRKFGSKFGLSNVTISQRQEAPDEVYFSSLSAIQ